MIKKLLEQLQKDADKNGIRLQQAFSNYIDELYQLVLDQNLTTARSAAYLHSVGQHPFQDILAALAVEVGRMDFKRGQFMTPFDCAYNLAAMHGMDAPEALDPSCGTGVMGLVKLAQIRDKIVDRELGYAKIAYLDLEAVIHLNDLDLEMCKIATIQVFVNWVVHCQFLFELDLLVTQNNFITEWESKLNKIYQSEDSTQNFTSFSCAKKQNIMMNPPYGLKDYGFDYAKSHSHQERFAAGVPSKSNGEYAFILSGFDLLKDDKSKAFMILPRSVLFKNSTQKYRKYFREEKSLNAIVNLPSKVFAETAIPTCVFMFDKSKKDREKGIFMMDLDVAA